MMLMLRLDGTEINFAAAEGGVGAESNILIFNHNGNSFYFA